MDKQGTGRSRSRDIDHYRPGWPEEAEEDGEDAEAEQVAEGQEQDLNTNIVERKEIENSSYQSKKLTNQKVWLL